MRASWGLGDLAVTTGAVTTRKSKVAVHRLSNGTCFTFTSGLRSITDKVLNYASAALANSDLLRLFEVANLLGELLRRAREEDERDLQRSGFIFDAHLLLAGRLGGDQSATAFLIYPQGNWIEVGEDVPYLTIGRRSPALAVLDGLVTRGSCLSQALKIAALAMDAASANFANVRYPIDTVVLPNRSPQLLQARLNERDIAPLLKHWRESLRYALATAPSIDVGGVTTTANGSLQ